MLKELTSLLVNHEYVPYPEGNHISEQMPLDPEESQNWSNNVVWVHKTAKRV